MRDPFDRPSPLLTPLVALSLATPRVTTIRFEVRSHRGPGGGLTELVVR